MLRACAEAADKQRRDKTRDTTAEASKNVAKSCECGTERQHRCGAETFSNKTRRNLEAGQRTRKDCSHQPQRRKAETEYALPDRQHHVDEIGVAVMQCMRATGNAKGTALRGLRRNGIRHRRVVRGRAHGASLTETEFLRWQSGNASHRRRQRRNLSLPAAFSLRRERLP